MLINQICICEDDFGISRFLKLGNLEKQGLMPRLTQSPIWKEIADEFNNAPDWIVARLFNSTPLLKGWMRGVLSDPCEKRGRSLLALENIQKWAEHLF
jgi:hypothetical protein